MTSKAPQPVRRKDYKPPDFLIDRVDLTFDLRDDGATVSSRLEVRRNPAADGRGRALTLDGEALELRKVALDGRVLPADRATLADGTLTLADPPDRFTLEIETGLKPHENTALSGLYVSAGNVFTQCEAEGFRRITYFLDRPDVMARYSTTIVADRSRYPVLLSNGNLVATGDSGNGRHWVKWDDPFPKPSYLFALVAGDLAAHEDEFVTRSGRPVPLRIYVRREDLGKCEHAMRSLKRAMRWDEEVYGREYDLDTFMIVAVSDFNAGAMENKGLNIFNTKYVLARPETATDTDYQNIEGVIAHEYFHNWTGNRVTCRDWFQLSLKEGLTVFRDQEFSADMGSRPVKRIAEVRRLRQAQFPEDAGPTAHPVRPDSYIAIDNFYTPTVYEKGAEVVRMIHRLLGAERFRAGTDLYFERHDGQAVTCDDFVAAMEDAGGVDLGQFRLWYAQAGTPAIEAEESWDAAKGEYRLTLRQKTPATPGQPKKRPMLIPVAVGLVGNDGGDLPARLSDEKDATEGTRVLSLTGTEQSFRFVGLAERPVPSLLRGFSAPIKLAPQPRDRLFFLFGRDGDPFARWEAGQQLATQLLLDMVAARARGEAMALDPDFIDAFARTLADNRLDKALLAEALTLPSESYLADQMKTVDPEGIHDARDAAARAIVATLGDRLGAAYAANRDDGPYRIDPEAIGRRALKNFCLAYLAAPEGGGEGRALARIQVRRGANMTDTLAALAVLNDFAGEDREAAFATFHESWKGEALVVDKWFQLQAASRLPDALRRVQDLTRHPDFRLANPNRVYALIGGFASGNPLRFHAADGSGYRFLADRVMELDRLNPQVAARIVTPLARWRRQDAGRGRQMRAELGRLLAQPGVSKNIYEIATMALK